VSILPNSRELCTCNIRALYLARLNKHVPQLVEIPAVSSQIYLPAY
jgi:hypothetical protein